MHKILVNTHKESNINILKARDYYFDKARFINNCLRRTCLLGPIVIFFICTFSVSIMRILSLETSAQWVEQYIDIIVGCVTIVAFVIDFLLKRKVDNNLLISNVLREKYDVKVLGIAENPFYYTFDAAAINNFLEVAPRIKDKDKYEVWYREIFSKDDFANAICIMMDNIIYTYCVYSENQKRNAIKLFLVLSFFLLYCIFYAVGNNFWGVINPFILFLAIFDYIVDLIDAYCVSKDLAQKNETLKNAIIEKSGSLSSSNEDRQLILRCIQDVIMDNREKSLFIPKYIREKYLDNNSKFYEELDVVKNLFWGKNVEKPQTASDFQICSVEDENKLINLETIHNELKKMLEDVKNCLDENGISFMLDGGTLIGACRRSNNHSFLAWDDDIDISVKSSDVHRIQKMIEKELGDKYVIQNYDNEDYYSPRLSTFRIRQKNCDSIVCEKDSELYELYDNKGLFLDVYAYCPILGNKWIDAAYRFLLIHPLNNKIRKIESQWKIGKTPEKSRLKFIQLKKKYKKRAEWYIRHAENEDYVTYEPFYIYGSKLFENSKLLKNIRKPGPYIKSKDIYGEKTTKFFEGLICEVPSNSDAVLTAFYGEDWEQSPFLSIEDLVEKEKLIYSKAKFDASCYKHLKKVSIYKEKEIGV